MAGSLAGDGEDDGPADPRRRSACHHHARLHLFRLERRSGSAKKGERYAESRPSNHHLPCLLATANQGDLSLWQRPRPRLVP
jgi:hypothetical protein